jgi:hypothetical protein
MRPFIVIWLTICLASLASAFQQPTNPLGHGSEATARGFGSVRLQG